MLSIVHSYKIVIFLTYFTILKSIIIGSYADESCDMSHMIPPIGDPRLDFLTRQQIIRFYYASPSFSNKETAFIVFKYGRKTFSYSKIQKRIFKNYQLSGAIKRKILDGDRKFFGRKNKDRPQTKKDWLIADRIRRPELIISQRSLQL